jgi:hypothetical protein
MAQAWVYPLRRKKARTRRAGGLAMDWIEKIFDYIDPIKAGAAASLVIVALIKSAWDSWS